MAEVKISDYIMRRLEEYGVRDMFLLSGGGMMHLLDSVARSNINFYCNLHEQASAIAADGYAQASGGLGVCMVTTGPGGTNAVTGCAASWIDGTPVLFISGQVRRAVMVGGSGLRQVGDQEIGIVEIVRSITKYAVTIMEPEKTAYHLEKAIYLATHGRQGPVWVDVPLDIQGMKFDEDKFLHFDPDAEGLMADEPPAPDTETVRAIADMLRSAKRPVIMFGYGVVAAKAQDDLRRLVRRLGIPVLGTMRSKGCFADNDELFFGYPGALAPRYSNFVLQNADCVVFIGTRLHVVKTGYDEAHFAFKAEKAYVNIDADEIKHFSDLINFKYTLRADASEFIRALDVEMKDVRTGEIDEWRDYCAQAKSRFPMANERQLRNVDFVNLYKLCGKLSNKDRDSDVVVSCSSGKAGTLTLIYDVAQNQVIVLSKGLGSMGFGLPQAIGVCIAKVKPRTIIMEGDGSIQHNLQELALIRQYSLPIKLFYVSNGGYSSIKNMQDNNFGSNYAGCHKESGVGLPSAEKLAALYDLPYYCIKSDDEIDAVLAQIMKDDEPCLCEIFIDIDFEMIPRTATRIYPDGRMSSSRLEDLYPFLPEDELAYWNSF